MGLWEGVCVGGAWVLVVVGSGVQECGYGRGQRWSGECVFNNEHIMLWIEPIEERMRVIVQVGSLLGVWVCVPWAVVGVVSGFQ